MTSLLSRLWPVNLRQPVNLHLDLRVLAFTAAVTLLTGILFGFAPALRASRHAVNDSLKSAESRTGEAREGRRLRSGLVVAEIAFATLVLVVGVLTFRSLSRLLHVDPGFDPDHVLTMQVALPASRYQHEPQVNAFYQRLLERLRGTRGVEAAAAGSYVPLGPAGHQNGDFNYEGEPSNRKSVDGPFADQVFVYPGYFATLRIPLLRGRVLDEHDTPESPQVVVLNKTMAERLWPGQDAVGKHIRINSPGNGLPQTVVGVVGDVKSEGLSQPAPLAAYIPDSQVGTLRMTVVVRTSLPDDAIAAARNAIAGMDRDLPIANITFMDQFVSASTSIERAATVVLGSFAILALFLAAVGIYGVMSYSVAQRTRELGVRMALGASRGNILALVLGSGIRIAIFGAALGFAASFAVTRFMRTLLFGVGTTDPFSFAAAAVLLGSIALLASYVPALRALRVDPLVALRYE
jgi:putative ABC transport system permease protein